MSNRYSSIAIVLHWAIAFFIAANLVLGFFIPTLRPPWYSRVLIFHMSSGISVLVLTVLRVLWRLGHRPPEFPAVMNSTQRYAARAVHLLLYVGMVVMPLSGWAMMSANAPYGTPGAAYRATLGLPGPRPGSPPPKVWWTTPLPLIQPIRRIGATPGGVMPQYELHEVLVKWHGTGGYIMIALLTLHLLGALKHQFIDKVPELARMGLGRRRLQ